MSDSGVNAGDPVRHWRTVSPRIEVVGLQFHPDAARAFSQAIARARRTRGGVVSVRLESRRTPDFEAPHIAVYGQVRQRRLFGALSVQEWEVGRLPAGDEADEVAALLAAGTPVEAVLTEDPSPDAGLPSLGLTIRAAAPADPGSDRPRGKPSLRVVR
ncbi:MAG: hypothetical protein R3D60_06455 [Paracoccaceae bacterium]